MCLREKEKTREGQGSTPGSTPLHQSLFCVQAGRPGFPVLDRERLGPYCDGARHVSFLLL
jgi:hypothetical protein